MTPPGTISVSACPLCRSRSGRAFTVGDTGLKRCRRCRLVYALEVAEPESVYTDDYLTSASRFGPDTCDPIVAAIGAAAAAHRLAVVERQTPVGSLLDVGCGSGEALDVARDRGWTAIGLEPVRASVERAHSRGHDVRHGTIETCELAPQSFDAVVASHVLEHVLDPVDFLRRIASYARPGGSVVVEVPNWLHRTRREAGAGWDQLCPLEHTMHFTPSTIRRAMRSAGLRAQIETVTVVRPSRADRFGRGFAIVATAVT